MSSKVELSKAKLKDWRHNSKQFCYEVLKFDPDPWQRDVLSNYDDPAKQRLAMKACKGPGKTALLAAMCWHFLSVWPFPKVAATSITEDNLSDGLWAEMAKWQRHHDYLKDTFVWTKRRIFAKEYPEDWFMSARTWSKSATGEQQANTLAGLHADFIMFVLDESGGIPDAVMAAAEAALANDMGGKKTRAKLVQAGNPTHLEGPLYRASTSERHLWYVIEITADPDDPKRTPRVSKQWAREQIEKYGRDNPWVLVNVFGQFPPSSLNALLGPDEVSKAMGKHLTADQYDFAQKRLGVDVARFGDDRTIIFPRQGLASFTPVEMRGARTNEIAARVMAAKMKWGSELEFIDGTGGYGAGVVDSLLQAHQNPQEINFASSADESTRYLNKRAEMWFRMADWIKRGGALPPIPQLQRELTAPTYWFSSGKFQLEGKEQIKGRLGYSPDMADALALTFAFVEMPATRQHGLHRPGTHGRAKIDYDPYNR